MAVSLLEAHKITRAHGTRVILDQVTIRVDPRSRIGVVGPNGSGKSTLLRILAGIEAPDGGEVRRHGTVGYLPQLVAGEGDETGQTVEDTLLERIGVGPAEREMDRLAVLIAAEDLSAVDAHAAAVERWVTLGGPDAHARIAAAAADLGIAESLLGQRVETLSGGQAARAGLAALRAARFDVVLLDEPSNHLDADGLAALRALLAEREGGVVLVSHDRALLEDAVDELLELDLRGGTTTLFSGGWDAYERERRTSARRAREAYAQAIQERTRLAAAERDSRGRAAATLRQAARRPKDPDKIGRAHAAARGESVQRRARVLADRATRIDVPEKPWDVTPLRLELDAAERAGRWLVALSGAELGRGGFVLGPIDFSVAYGDRVLVRGANGSGKSTLLAALLGRIEPVSGARQVAAGAVIAELGQQRAGLLGAGADPGAAAERVALVEVVRRATGLDPASARTALAAFGLDAEMVERPAASLSAGERTRAELAVLAHLRATCLVLDEPTNHLDVESLEVLEAALAGWPGALVAATHDLRFAESVEFNRFVDL
jgi:ATPase subunit of ABC transporter with duplicated ATPase domains